VNAFESTERDLDPKEVQEKLDAGEIQLIDVREPYEWEAGRIVGALHIELEHLARRSGEVERDKPVVFHCRLGRRSAMATEAFRASGYDAYNMAGGIEAWAEAGLPLEPEGGEVVDHAVGPDRAHL
jgi:rhodanese-related sulfurtransferase